MCACNVKSYIKHPGCSQSHCCSCQGMSNYGRWQWNSCSGPDYMWGWVFTQGHWDWGATITWHAVKIGQNDYYWLGFAWTWKAATQSWDCERVVSMAEDPIHIEDWMVHEV